MNDHVIDESPPLTDTEINKALPRALIMSAWGVMMPDTEHRKKVIRELVLTPVYLDGMGRSLRHILGTDSGAIRLETHSDIIRNEFDPMPSTLIVWGEYEFMMLVWQIGYFKKKGLVAPTFRHTLQDCHLIDLQATLTFLKGKDKLLGLEEALEEEGLDTKDVRSSIETRSHRIGDLALAHMMDVE